jgi:Mrp family chromosome partitioning ATPase
LEKLTGVSAPKQSTVITVHYTARSPELAHDVVEALTGVFLEQYARLNQTDGSLKFFAEQADKLRSDLASAQEKLRDRKNAYQLTSAASRRSIVEQGKDALRKKVYDLQLEENDLASRYTDDYPPLKDLRRQRELAEKALIDLPHASNAVDAPASGDGKPEISGDRARTKASPAVLQVAKPATEQQGRLNSELQTLNDQELELAQLEREVNLLAGKYAMHVEKLEEARINDALSRERITNVKVAQPASLVYKPVSPKKGWVLAGALLLAFVGGIGSAFAAEGLDQTLRTTSQVEKQLGLPVLASIPRRNKGRRSLKSAAPSASQSAGVSTGAESHVQRSGYQGILATLRLNGNAESRRSKTIGVVGCEASPERSRVAGNLAVEAANSGTETVLLIDADSRRRRVSKRFRTNETAGWRDELAGAVPVKSCVQQTTPRNLAVMGPGGTNGASSDAVAPSNAATDLERLKNDYSLVVVDLPCSGQLEGVPVATIDEAVLVVDAERTRIQAAQRAKNMLERAGIPIAGVVLANRRDYIPRWLYQRL